MAKFHGFIGFSKTEEARPGVYKDTSVEKEYGGDLLKNIRSIQNSGNVNDDITISNQISVVADEYAFKNYSFIRYVEWNGFKWRVSSIDVQYPRLILTLGGVYNG